MEEGEKKSEGNSGSQYHWHKIIYKKFKSQNKHLFKTLLLSEFWLEVVSTLSNRRDLLHF